jgi:hypothetical protein
MLSATGWLFKKKSIGKRSKVEAADTSEWENYNSVDALVIYVAFP